MRLLITGGAGCLGSNLAEHYLAAGHEVCTIDNYVTGHRLSLPEGHPRLTIVDGSILDEGLLERVFAEFQPTHVIHSAASYRDPDDWITDARVNGEGSILVIRACEAAGVKRLVNFHTALGYGRPDNVPIPVSAPARPFTSYGVSKQAGENYVAMSTVPWVSLRLANVTGPRLAIGPIPTFYTRLKADKSCFCSRTVRDFIDMEDFLAIVDKALEQGAPTGIFNVSTGTGHTIRDIFRLVSAHVGKDPDADVPEVDPGPDDVPAVVLDPKETIAAFGWEPRHGFADIIARMLSWYDSHGVTAIFSHLKSPDFEKEGTSK
ncbi:NAD-dependent epimerase/dehydratase family protein [Rhizobium sp. AQ_MP]|uniref:NAD-dependent epimerase/dehydratase family protein n=1 Tax=Rhizobium sp. AQ_MP TaxID=2761536 RepID=UPI001639F6E7|nr:NAD-dependent epimerase/dehydratase family protein [Rhizobium sp. AQ_MP]MBC2775769.1 NAD-dependent epimerase/dehydratase family protein [Rhizobium sp. AQ_MP]